MGGSVFVRQAMPGPVKPSFSNRALKVSTALAIEQESNFANSLNNCGGGFGFMGMLR
jgi:hypothetical protein